MYPTNYLGLIYGAEPGLADATEPLEVVRACDGETAAQLRWLKTWIKQAAPQALIAT